MKRCQMELYLTLSKTQILKTPNTSVRPRLPSQEIPPFFRHYNFNHFGKFL